LYEQRQKQARIPEEVMTRYFIAGGAGFIGSHLATKLLMSDPDAVVNVFDSFSTGREWHLTSIGQDPRLTIVKGEISDTGLLGRVMEGCDVVYHLAANPENSKTENEPYMDFWEGTFLTQQILEAMRKTTQRTILSASGSWVYGEAGTELIKETFSPMVPISTHGAAKLAGEALISAYCHLFDFRGAVFRLANVVGPHQTRGVVYDFVQRLRQDPAQRTIRGDGSQAGPISMSMM